MAISLTLTAAANAAAQYLGALDSGEALSTQQIADALLIANNLLDNWYQEQALAMQQFISQQSKLIAEFIDKLSGIGIPLAQAYTLAGGSYVPALPTSPSFTPGTIPQFASVGSAITFPTGVARAFQLALAIEMGPQYDMAPTETLQANAREAKAAAFPVPGRVPVPLTSGAGLVPLASAEEQK